MPTESKADERFSAGNMSDLLRYSAIPATIAAGLAGYVYTRARKPSPTDPTLDMRSSGERAYDVFKDWGQVTPMERHRPPNVRVAPFEIGWGSARPAYSPQVPYVNHWSTGVPWHPEASARAVSED